MEPDQIDILAFAVLRNLKQIDDAKETRLARQLRSDIRKTDGLDRVHLDLTFFHTVAGAHFDVRAHPYSDTARDFSATNALAKPLGEHHEESLSGIAARRTLRVALEEPAGQAAVDKIARPAAKAPGTRSPAYNYIPWQRRSAQERPLMRRLNDESRGSSRNSLRLLIRGRERGAV
jgi:hypothetical protein